MRMPRWGVTLVCPWILAASAWGAIPIVPGQSYTLQGYLHLRGTEVWISSAPGSADRSGPSGGPQDLKLVDGTYTDVRGAAARYTSSAMLTVVGVARDQETLAVSRIDPGTDVENGLGTAPTSSHPQPELPVMPLGDGGQPPVPPPPLEVPPMGGPQEGPRPPYEKFPGAPTLPGALVYVTSVVLEGSHLIIKGTMEACVGFMNLNLHEDRAGDPMHRTLLFLENLAPPCPGSKDMSVEVTTRVDLKARYGKPPVSLVIRAANGREFPVEWK